MADIKFEIWRPSHQVAIVSAADLPDLYREAGTASPATFTWNDGGEHVLIVTVGVDYSTVTMLADDTFSNLTISDVAGFREIDIGGQPTEYPINAILPRPVGLAVLLNAERFDDLQHQYTWVDQ